MTRIAERQGGVVVPNREAHPAGPRAIRRSVPIPHSRIVMAKCSAVRICAWKILKRGCGWRHGCRDVHPAADPLQRAVGNPQFRCNPRARPGPDVLIELGAFDCGHGQYAVGRTLTWTLTLQPRGTALDENNLWGKVLRRFVSENGRNMPVPDRRHLMQPSVGAEDRLVPKVHVRIDEGHGCRRIQMKTNAIRNRNGQDPERGMA